jgi:hypothetical protein
LISKPIRKVLSSMRAHRVRALLMGGQACVFYGAAEFSRDTDFAIVADAVNLARLRQALAELQAAPPVLRLSRPSAGVSTASLLQMFQQHVEFDPLKLTRQNVLWV